MQRTPSFLACWQRARFALPLFADVRVKQISNIYLADNDSAMGTMKEHEATRKTAAIEVFRMPFGSLGCA